MRKGMETVRLQFEKRIPSDKDEIIFHFLAFDYEDSTNYGDVIVNLSTNKFCMPEEVKSKEMKSIRKYIDSILYISKVKLDEEQIKFECEEKLTGNLLEECKKIKSVII